MVTSLAIPHASRGSYRYWFTLRPVPSTGEHCLDVSSQLLHGKDPKHLARQLQISCDQQDLELLHEWLGRYLKGGQL